MAKLESAEAERVANYFVSYLFDEYQGTRHVRRVAAWIGLIILGIAKLPDVSWKVPRERQLVFEYRGRKFKTRYSHKIGSRGGIELLEVLPGRGSPEGDVVVTIKNLANAERFYRRAPRIFGSFIENHPGVAVHA